MERQRQLARIAAVANPFRNLVEEIGWPILEVYRTLQHRQSTLSVHPLSDLEGLRPTPPYRVVFGTWSPKPDRQSA
jgi:hypothetical protein